MRRGAIKKRVREKGFSLVELAIVLGVMGIISAAIWATANVVRDRQPIQDMVQAVTDVSTRVRGIYSGFPNAAEVPATIADQVTAGLFPLNIVNGNTTVNPWGGDVSVIFPQAPMYGFSVQVTLPVAMDRTLRRSACMGMITRLAGTATSYVGGTTGVLPDAVVRLEPAQGVGPSLSFVRAGAAWTNVTGQNFSQISVILNANECTGMAFYYKL